MSPFFIRRGAAWSVRRPCLRYPPVRRDMTIQTDPTDALGFKAARAMCRGWEDFTFAARFLDRRKRDAVCSVVAFFGMIADAIGAMPPPGRANERSAM